MDPGTVIINARAAVRAEISGVERWAREMVERLPPLRPDAYAIAAPRPRLAHRPGHLWEQVVLPARGMRTRADVIFSPANLAPLAWPRNVVVVHDAVVLSHPEWFSRAYAAWHVAALRMIVRRADRLIVPSEFSAGELVDLAGVARDRIHVVPGGVDERFSPDVDPARAREALGLDRPYVLTVGGAGLRKNLRALEPVAALLADEGVDTVAAGVRRSHHAHSDDVTAIRGLGYVPEDLLPSLYAGAEAFVLPSLHEGFGLTCVEAMAAGVPVAASDRGALREACAGAALHFDPQDPEEMKKVVLRTVTDEGVRHRLRAAGRARAADLTWDNAARSVDAILLEAALR